MTPSPPTTRDITLQDIVRATWRHRLRWAATVVVVFGAAVVYAVKTPRTWEASQAIVVRDDSTGAQGTPGGVRREEDVKNRQQTLAELLVSRAVLERALKRAGPEGLGEETASWPTEEDVAGLRDAAALAPPKGSEFGKTDLFYLRVKDRDQHRALRMTDAIYQELQGAFCDLRAGVAKSAIVELSDTVTQAEGSLAQATLQLSEIEKQVGVDLAVLRVLHQSPGADTTLHRALTGTMEDLRQCRAAEQKHATMLDLLNKAKEDPLLLMAAPQDVLEYHPGLASLVEGLTKSRLQTAARAAKLTPEHPEMQAALREEAGIRDDIRRQLAVVIEGASAARALCAARRTALESHEAGLNERLKRLTDARASYSNLVAQVEQRRTLFDDAQRRLGQAKATLAAASTHSLLTRVEAADGGLGPVGPSRAKIALGGLFGGALAGFGVVLLTARVDRGDETRRLKAPRSRSRPPTPRCRKGPENGHVRVRPSGPPVSNRFDT